MLPILGCLKMSDDSYSSNQRVVAEKLFTISSEGSWSSGNLFPELVFQTQEIEQRLQISNYPTKTKNKNGIPQSIHHFFTRNNCKNLTSLLASDKKSIPCLETWIPQTTSISKVQEELRQRSVEEIKREENGNCGKLVSRAHWELRLYLANLRSKSDDVAWSNPSLFTPSLSLAQFRLCQVNFWVCFRKKAKYWILDSKTEVKPLNKEPSNLQISKSDVKNLILLALA